MRVMPIGPDLVEHSAHLSTCADVPAVDGDDHVSTSVNVPPVERNAHASTSVNVAPSLAPYDPLIPAARSRRDHGQEEI